MARSLRPTTIGRLVFFVIVRSVYQTERASSNLTLDVKYAVHFRAGLEEAIFFGLDDFAPHVECAYSVEHTRDGAIEEFPSINKTVS